MTVSAHMFHSDAPEWSTSSAPSGYDRNGYTTSSRASEPANSNRSWLVTAGTGR